MSPIWHQFEWSPPKKYTKKTLKNGKTQWIWGQQVKMIQWAKMFSTGKVLWDLPNSGCSILIWTHNVLHKANYKLLKRRGRIYPIIVPYIYIYEPMRPDVIIYVRPASWDPSGNHFCPSNPSNYHTPEFTCGPHWLTHGWFNLRRWYEY